MYSVISFWSGFNYNNGDFVHKYFKGHTCTTNHQETDLLLVGSFVTGEQYDIIKSLTCKKVLYISEPINSFFQPHVLRLFLENEFSMIFGCINHDISSNRFKLPLYTMYFNYHDKNIFLHTNQYAKTCIIENKKDCCLINRHDMLFSRTDIYNTLKDVLSIDCPSFLFNNCSNEELNNIGNVEYIKKYKFQICPENTRVNIPGYITEKLCQSILGCAIPIYYGYYDDIDEKIFNKNRILFFEKDNLQSILDVKDKIIHFLNHPDDFNSFYRQDPFCDTAYETLISLENDLISYIN
jgi:hypothetical protein